MNTIAYKSVISQAIMVPTANGLDAKATMLPMELNFATMLGGMMNPLGESKLTPTSTITIDDLIAQIDQLLAELTNNEEDGYDTGNDLIGENQSVQNLLAMLPIPLQQAIKQTLSGQTGSENNGSHRIDPFLKHHNTSLFDKGPLLRAIVANDIQTSNLTTRQMEANHIALADQQAILQTLRTMLVATNESPKTMSQADLAKLSQFIKQFSDGFSSIRDLQRISVAVETKGQIAKGEIMNFSRVAVQNNLNLAFQNPSHFNSQEQLSGGSNDSSDSSLMTSKVGFHQMVVGMQNGIQETMPQQMSEPVVRAQHFQKDMNELMIRQLQMTRFPNGVSEAHIRLFPENLGSVNVKLIVQQGILTAQFIAETHAGKELLESQLASLRASLITSGLQVDKLEVNMPNNPNNGQTQDSLHHQGNGHQDRQAEEIDYEDDAEEDFSTVFEEFSQAI